VENPLAERLSGSRSKMKPLNLLLHPNQSLVRLLLKGLKISTTTGYLCRHAKDHLLQRLVLL
jgi:hypothetical protein